jgi:hypothetical protein
MKRAAFAFIMLAGTMFLSANADGVRSVPAAVPTQPPLPVVTRLCIKPATDYALESWNFVAPYLLCYRGDRNTGGGVLFKQNADGSFSQASHGGGYYSVRNLEFLGVPASTAVKLVSGLHT